MCIRDRADGTYSVINTYAYITEIANGINIIDSVKDGEKLYDNIRFTKPKDYTCLLYTSRCV